MGATEERARAAGEPGRHGLRELIAERRAKADVCGRTRARSRTRSRTSSRSRRSSRAYEHLQAGEETEERHRVAGRIAARRVAGKAPSWISSTAPARSSCTRA